MIGTDPEKYAAHVRKVLRRWCVVLAAVAVLALWSTWRMQTAASRLSDTLSTATTNAPAEAGIEYWTCSMHPDVRQLAPGDCPKCGMELIPKYVGSDEPGVKPLGAISPHPHAGAPRAPKVWYRCTMPECGDQGSDDPDSRCPVCGMKREPVILDTAVETDEAEISLSQRARRLAELATEPVARRRLIKRIRTVGKVTYDETRRKMVSAWTSGRIDRLFADFTGMIVSKSDHLVEIYSPELVSAQEELLQALRSFEAMEPGPQAGARIPSRTTPARRRAEGLIVSAEQKLELLGITAQQIDELRQTGKAASHLVVCAPLGGTIVRKWAMEGMYVKTGDPLYEIADLTQVWLLLDLYETDLPWIMPFQDVRVTAQSLPGEEFHGEIVFVDPFVDKATRTIKVRVNVSNPDRRLKPEMFVTAEIDAAVGEGGKAATPAPRGAYACPMHTWETADAPTACPICEMDMVPVETIPGHTEARPAVPVLSVPAEAVMRTGQRSLIYIETDPRVYRGVEIRVGPVAQDKTGRRFYPVLDGLKEGQKVVTRGNFVIDSQMQIAGKPSLFNARGLTPAPMYRHGRHPTPPVLPESEKPPMPPHDDEMGRSGQGDRPDD